MPDLTKIVKTSNLLIRIVILLLAYGFLTWQLLYKHDINQLFRAFSELSFIGYFTILVVFLGLFINWGLEAFKWRLVIGKIEQLNFFDSLKAVFAGLTVGLYTPNRLGEFLGRIFMLKTAGRIESSLLTFAASYSQLLTTLVFGFFGLILFSPFPSDLANTNVVIFTQIGIFSYLVLLIISFLVFFNIHLSFKALHWFPVSFREKFEKKILVLSLLLRKDLAVLSSISFLRYAVFFMQYYLLLITFIPGITLFDGFKIISLIFLCLTVVPVFVIAEPAIRGSVALFVTHFYFIYQGLDPDDYSLAIITVSTMLWLINIVIPAVIGSFCIPGLVFFRSKPVR